MQAQIAKTQGVYNEIVRLYDFIERIVSAIEKDGSSRAENNLVTVQPLIEKVESCADTLTNIYISHVEAGIEPDEDTKAMAENSIIEMYKTLQKCKCELKEEL